jgi:hypothetical protein
VTYVKPAQGFRARYEAVMVGGNPPPLTLGKLSWSAEIRHSRAREQWPLACGFGE